MGEGNVVPSSVVPVELCWSWILDNSNWSVMGMDNSTT